jgi:hypothetical protein
MYVVELSDSACNPIIKVQGLVNSLSIGKRWTLFFEYSWKVEHSQNEYLESGQNPGLLYGPTEILIL